ncbi:MAG: DUF1565 domain-containing protein [Candidatus Eisenbacteria bacterium]|nr:DUF1565 domain-containing protein [Candidatus Eisenbacteria bacterium]
MHCFAASTIQTLRSRGALLALVLIAVPSAARATAFYVSPAGSDANPGTQASPWATIARANSTLNAGDVVFIAPGNYADPIKPSHNGNSIAQRISYVGDLASPSQVVVKDIYVERAYVSVKGVTSSATFTLYYTSETAKAVYDSIAWCVSNGGGFGSAGAKNSVVANNIINGSVSFLMNLWYTLPPGAISSIADTLRNNVIHIGTITVKGFQMRGFTQSCVIDSNRIDAFFALANGSDVQCRYLYNTYNNLFRDNSWRIEADGPLAGTQYVAFALRDSSHDNLFERDSMICGVQSNFDIGGRLVNAGNAAWVGLCVNNHWKDCYFLTTGYTFNQDLLNNSLIEGCVFASKHSQGLYILGPIQNTIIRNCTIVSWAGAPMKLEGDPRAGGNQFYSNIFYTDSVAHCASGRPVLFHGYSTGFTEDHNLFFSRATEGGITPANESLYWLSTYCSAPGPGTQWANDTGNDVASKYGDPQFATASYNGFDPHIQSGSLARGLGGGGVDAGAYPFATAGPDVTPPATINNLAAALVSDQTVVLTWTAPGDDGTLGVASAYDLRYSTQPITDDASFAAATPVAVEPTPGSSGSAQSYVQMGLTAGTHYYFAIKARDEASNWSLLGTVLNLTMQTTDQVPPKSIGDLH